MEHTAIGVVPDWAPDVSGPAALRRWLEGCATPSREGRFPTATEVRIFSARGPAFYVLADGPSADWLSPEERVRRDRFHFAEDARRYTAAHVLLRGALSATFDHSPWHWEFDAGAHGKPSVVAAQQPNGTSLEISLTHGGDIVACAIAIGRPVGIDVEPLGRRIDPAIADRFFAPDETHWIRQQPDAAAVRRAFFRVWTLKEAVVKATGLGLSQSLSGFVLKFDPLHMASVSPEMAAKDLWALGQSDALRDHLVAIATLGRSYVQHVHWE